MPFEQMSPTHVLRLWGENSQQVLEIMRKTGLSMKNEKICTSDRVELIKRDLKWDREVEQQSPDA